MRYPVVLFDLDGTVVDSGGIILASMRHATRTVLGRDIPDEALMAAVGGPGLEHQMRVLGPEHVEELIRVYREHNEPLHEELQACDGVLDVLPELRRRRARLGIVTAKRMATVRLAFDVEAARRAGVHSVAVTWGGIHSRETLENARADTLVDSPEELLGVL